MTCPWTERMEFEQRAFSRKLNHIASLQPDWKPRYPIQRVREWLAEAGQRTYIGAATDYANAICDALKPFCHRIEIGGDLRRGHPWMWFVDIVVSTDRWRDVLNAADAQSYVTHATDRYAEVICNDGTRIRLWRDMNPNRMVEEKHVLHQV